MIYHFSQEISFRIYFNRGFFSHDGNPLQRTYRPRILRSYPDITSWSQFNPEAASRLILPQGLRFCTDKEISQRENSGTSPKCHSFILTKEDGEKSHGLSIVFYEPVQDNNICNALHTLQKMYYNTEGSEGNLTMHKICFLIR